MNTFIKQIDDLISPEECAKFLENFKTACLSTKKDEINFDGEQHEFMNLDKIDTLKDFDKRVKILSEQEVGKYVHSYKYLSTRFYLENSILLKLAPHKTLPLHYDNEISEAYGTAALRRNFIVLFYLQNIEGGELYFPEQKVLIKPKPGRMVIMPTFFTHPHTVFPAMEERYAYRVNFFIDNGTNDRRNY